MHVYLECIPLTRWQLTVPVFAAVDSDDMLCGVEEPPAVVRPKQGPGWGIGIELYSQAQALSLLDIRLYWTWAS